jgi:hypothetical protein
MQPFNVLIEDVSDPELGPLLTKLKDAGFSKPSVTSADGPAPEPKQGGRSAATDLPQEWELVRKLDGQSYSWPDVEEHYERYAIYAGKTAGEGAVHIALGEAGRAKVFGRDRKYTIAFLTSGAPQTPLVEFLEADDFDETNEMLAIIRGRDGAGSRAMFGPADALPPIYDERFRTEIYRDRVQYPGAWRKIAVIAREDDPETMLNHALLQARRRGDL